MVWAEAGYPRQSFQRNHLVQMRADVLKCGLDTDFRRSQRKPREAAQAGDVTFSLGVSGRAKEHGVSALGAPGGA